MSVFDARAEARRWFQAIWPGLAPDEDIIKLLGDAFGELYVAGLHNASEVARGERDNRERREEYMMLGARACIVMANRIADAIDREARDVTR